MVLSDEEAKAAQEIAKTTGKALPLIEGFGQFVARIVGGSLEEGMGIVEDKLKFIRWKRQQRFMERANEFLAASSVDENLNPLPLNVALPLVQAATLEENDELQDRWAKLLVNALDPNSETEVRRALISILEDFGPLDAALLDRIADAPPEASPEEDFVRIEALSDNYVVQDNDENPIKLQQHVELALWNLVRLGCISPATTWGGGLSIASVKLTELGRAMVRACRLNSEETNSSSIIVAGE